MNRDLLRKMVLYPFQEGKYYPESDCSEKEKQFLEAFKKTSSLEQKIQTLIFNFTDESRFLMIEPANIINSDWILVMGLLHIYLESYLICSIFRNDSLFSFDEEIMMNIKKYRDKTLAHIENFNVDNKSGEELITDIKYMVFLISKYMCELINEENPDPKFLSFRWEDERLGLTYTSTMKCNTDRGLEALYYKLTNL